MTTCPGLLRLILQVDEPCIHLLVNKQEINELEEARQSITELNKLHFEENESGCSSYCPCIPLCSCSKHDLIQYTIIRNSFTREEFEILEDVKFHLRSLNMDHVKKNLSYIRFKEESFYVILHIRKITQIMRDVGLCEDAISLVLASFHVENNDVKRFVLEDHLESISAGILKEKFFPDTSTD
jgi:hypothetical protein